MIRVTDTDTRIKDRLTQNREMHENKKWILDWEILNWHFSLKNSLILSIKTWLNVYLSCHMAHQFDSKTQFSRTSRITGVIWILLIASRNCRPVMSTTIGRYISILSKAISASGSMDGFYEYVVTQSKSNTEYFSCDSVVPTSRDPQEGHHGATLPNANARLRLLCTG